MNHALKPSASASRMDWFLLALLGVSLTGNVLLGYGVFRLSMRLDSGAAQARSQEPQGPAVGTRLPALDVQTVEGARVSLAFDSDPRPTVIYVFTPECSWCARNLENVKALMATGQQSYRFVGLSLNPDVPGVTRYVKDAGLEFPVYLNPSRDVRLAYGLGGTPSTLVVSTEGVLLKSWLGAYTAESQREVQDYFHVRLPGLVARKAG